VPEERPSSAPVVDQAAWDRAKEGVPREMAAARLIVSREIGGIPYRPYLMGDSDHAPVVKAVAGFAGKVYGLLDALETQPSDIAHSPEITSQIEVVRAAMEEFKL
jgi:hypothetical protein